MNTVSAFQKLVRDAAQHGHIRLSQTAEFHLVETLVLGMRDRNLFVYAIRALTQATQDVRPLGEAFVINGNRCLLMVGLFPAVIRRRNLDPRYYADVGRTSYLMAAGHSKPQEERYYTRLHREFFPMVETLRVMREMR